MSTRTVYQPVPDGPGALITDPPDQSDLKIIFSERRAQHDGKGWLYLAPVTATGVTALAYFKQCSALREYSKQEGELRGDGN